MIQNTWLTAPLETQSHFQHWQIPVTTHRERADSRELSNLLSGFSPITLKEMDAVALQNRVDTKFVIPIKKLLNIIPYLYQKYNILIIEGKRQCRYRTLYFDTTSFSLYNMHVNGWSERYKVRSREYIDSRLSFFEVKHKTRKDRTIKDRIQTDELVVSMNVETKGWLRDVFPFDSHKLEPKLWNMFTRITLVNKLCCERVTIDVDLTFYAPYNVVQLEGIAVAEVKKEGKQCVSPFLDLMRVHRNHPQGFSKYCVGTALLYDSVKKNSVKPQILWLEKVTKE